MWSPSDAWRDAYDSWKLRSPDDERARYDDDDGW
jgi:hypothetical protein